MNVEALSLASAALRLFSIAPVTDRGGMNRRTTLLLFLMTLHGSLLVTSTVAGSKLFALPFGLSASATVVSYMLTFVVPDTIAELYGAKLSRLVINLGLVGMALSALYFKLTIALPPAAAWPHQAAFETVLSSSWRIWLAGWLAYFASQYLDLWGFLMRDLTRGKAPLVVRAFVGMLVGQLFDTVVFMTIAVYGSFPLGPAILGQYLVKVAVASLGAPLVSLAVFSAKRFLGYAKTLPARGIG